MKNSKSFPVIQDYLNYCRKAHTAKDPRTAQRNRELAGQTLQIMTSATQDKAIGMALAEGILKGQK